MTDTGSTPPGRPPVSDAVEPYLRQGPAREPRTGQKTARGKSVAREWIESLTFTIVFVLLFTNFIAQATQVPTESMKPTIMVGDHFFLDKFAFPANYPEGIQPFLPQRTLERGDIIAFNAPDGGNIPFVKRIVGLPGEDVDLRSKVVYIDGAPLDEPYKIHVDNHVYGDEPWNAGGASRTGQLRAGHSTRGLLFRNGGQPRQQQRRPLLGLHQRPGRYRKAAVRVLVL